MMLQNAKRLKQYNINSLLGRPICFCRNFKNYSTQPDEPAKNKSRFLLKSTAVLGLGSILFGGLVWYDDRVRKIVEENVPYSKDILNDIFGIIDEKSKKINVNQLKNFFGKDSPPIPSLKNFDNENDQQKFTSSVLTLDSSSETKQIPTTNVGSSDSIIPVDVRKPIIVEDVKKEKPTDIIVDNESELQLIELLKIATDKSSIAKDKKFLTIDAIKKHSALLKEASGRGVTKEVGTDLWEKINKAESYVEECSKQDSTIEESARKAIDSLKMQIDEERLDPKKASSPVLRNSIETVKKLSLRLDELNLFLEKERSQHNVLLNHMKSLQNNLPQQFKEDYDSSAFSNINQNIGEKLNENRGLTEQELNEHLIHANIKIDQLKKQLQESKSKEDKTILEALEKQRSIDEKLSKLHVDIELQKAKENESQLIDEKKQQFRKEWEAEVDARLRLASLAHAEHLEKVIRTQKQLHDIENVQIVEEAINIERNKFAKQIELALDRLNEIEKALNSRMDQDLENRRSKIFWSICQNLLDSLIGIKNSNYSTHLNDIKLISILGEQDDFVQTICTCFPKYNYIQTEEGLKNRFERVHKLARYTAQIGENGGSPFDYFFSWLQSFFVLQIAKAKYSTEDKINIDKYEPYEILNRIKYFVKVGDLKNAVRLANLLKGESAQIFKDWIHDAQIYLEARFLTELLLLHSQVKSIRTIY